MAEEIVLAEQTFGFEYSASYNYYSCYDMPISKLVAGAEYTVTWNGVEYKCTANSVPIEGFPVVALGNAGILGAAENTSEPFCIILVSAFANQVNAFTLEDAATHTIAVSMKSILKEEIFAPRTLEGFSLTSYGFYGYQDIGLFSLEEGQSYIVSWDGTEYLCTGMSGFDGEYPFIAIGNKAAIFQEVTGEPFAITYMPGQEVNFFFSLDTSESHTVAVYKATEAQPKIVLKDLNGNDNTYEGVTAVKLNKDDGSTQIFSKGEAEEKTIALDFSAGDMEIAEENKLFSSVTIPKPETLLPENIAKDVTIAGVVGTLAGGGGTGPYISFDGDLSSDYNCTMYGFTEAPMGCFGQMTHLSVADMRESPDIKVISQSMFDGCASLQAVYMTDEITTIEQRAFFGCFYMPSIELPSKLTEIESLAFYGCMSLESLTIPSGVTSIGSEAFCECYNLTAVTFEDTNGWYVSATVNGEKIQIPSSDLANPATSATLLTSTYVDYNWYKE